MANLTPRKGPSSLENGVGDIRLKSEEQGTYEDTVVVSVKREPSSEGISGGETQSLSSLKKTSRSPLKAQSAQSPAVKTELVGGDVTIKQEPGKPLKLARTGTQKVERRPPILYDEWEDKTSEATSSFEVIRDCTYANKQLGITDPALECDCQEEWDSFTHSNDACGDDSDCINRATKMECAQDCGCGNNCQNQRFTRKQYADVSVFRTTKKGYGLRADTDLAANDFIFEYIGEVIGENAFRKRMQQYDQEGIKHFYFMSLEKGIFVDATRRGNLGRFCNHSCNPNCYVDKWVVGDKLRMGIFAERKILAGEELVFNYNVDRYGADPQPCYCGEPNCTGYIGGKTQTERSTKLSKATMEALGIDDIDSWDIAVAKKPRKKKGTDDDEEYVNNLQPKDLEEDGVRSIMSQLPQCKEKWVMVKMLDRMQKTEDVAVFHQVVRMHGYRHLKTALGNFSDDVNICLQILDILNRLPRITRNKIQDSKIEDAVQQLVTNEDERVATQAKDLLEIWSKLEIAYRIPRMKRDPAAIQQALKNERAERRDSERRKSRSRTRSSERVHAPSGPRHAAPRPRGPPRRPPPSGPLPSGWFEATAPNGSLYYYNQNGTTSWQRPTAPSGPVPPPPPPKAVSDQQRLTELISTIVANKKETTKPISSTATPEPTEQERRENKLRSYPEEKQKKLYEALIQPHVMHVVNKFKHKLEKEELKKLAKDISKKIVNSDFKNDQIKSLSTLNDKHAKKIKKHVHETFLKYLRKKAEHDKKKEAHAIKDKSSEPATNGGTKLDDEPALSDDEDGLKDSATPTTKRVREDDAEDEASKKMRTDTPELQVPPPPPPPEIDGSPMELDINGNGTVEETSSASYAASGLVIAGEPMQTATPPTTGSPDLEDGDKSAR